MRDNRVMESLAKKFEGKNSGDKYVMNQQDIRDYEAAMTKGDVTTMLTIKSGMKHRQEQEERFAQELETLDIKTVMTELKDIDKVIQGSEKLLKDKLEKNRADIEAEYQAKKEKLIRKGVPSGSIQFEILRSEYVKRMDEVEQAAQIRSLQRELNDLGVRKLQLEFMKEKYLKDNADILEEVRREQVKKNLRELGLVD